MGKCGSNHDAEKTKICRHVFDKTKHLQGGDMVGWTCLTTVPGPAKILEWIVRNTLPNLLDLFGEVASRCHRCVDEIR